MVIVVVVVILLSLLLCSFAKLHRTINFIPPASFELLLIPKEAAFVLLAEVALYGGAASLLLLGKARATCTSVSATEEKKDKHHKQLPVPFLHDLSSEEHQARISRHDAFVQILEQ